MRPTRERHFTGYSTKCKSLFTLEETLIVKDGAFNGKRFKRQWSKPRSQQMGRVHFSYDIRPSVLIFLTFVHHVWDALRPVRAAMGVEIFHPVAHFAGMTLL